ncbi:MAG: DUF5615 family PIN-like protein [Tepidisphaerales bacterium]
MGRLYCNENFPLPAVIELRRLGHDCVTVVESGNANIQFTDADVLAFATANARAVLTFNRRHFIALHKQQPDHAGIIVCTIDPDFAALAQRIHESIVPFHGDLRGQLVRVTRRA